MREIGQVVGELEHALHYPSSSVSERNFSRILRLLRASVNTWLARMNHGS